VCRDPARDQHLHSGHHGEQECECDQKFRSGHDKFPVHWFVLRTVHLLLRTVPTSPPRSDYLRTAKHFDRLHVRSRWCVGRLVCSLSALPLNSAANPTSDLRFRKTWRPYQKRVLDAAKEHLSDGRIHIVAAPGAGKTTVGLEIFRMVGKPTLVLAPSRTIRDQWISRLADFLPDAANSRPLWAGITLEAPAYFTVITYQALHSKFRSRDAPEIEDRTSTAEEESPPTETELNEVIAYCRNNHVGTIILDEAHHLRQEWWRTLSKLLQAIGNPLLVSLTATPPYDVVSLEWRRYEELCGPIDEEISAPELVRAGTLCPHQDYIWTCSPSDKDVITARQHDEAVRVLLSEMASDATLRDAVLGHSWMQADQPDAEAVLEDPEFAIAAMAFLQLCGREPPSALLTLMDCRKEDVPKMDRRWWSILLERYIFAEVWPLAFKEHRENLLKRMRQTGLLYRRELRLMKHAGLQSGFSQSSAKLESCLSIHRLERTTRGDDLRQVILTDFIRDGEPDRLGAWPVFCRIVRGICHEDAKGVALLTGQLGIVHDVLLDPLRMEMPSLVTTADPQLPGFSRIEGSRLTDFLTRALGDGKIHTLIGTRALLGEGWDCPAVNSLILGSFVGSFMTTNQMRGRAIRVDHSRPHKAASIWHLVAVDPTTPMGFCDIVQLEERFVTFAGLHATQPIIESGLKRLNMGQISAQHHLLAWNEESARRAAKHHELEARWKAAVELGVEHRMLAAVESKPPPKLRQFLYSNTLLYLLYSAASAFAAGAGTIFRGIRPGQFPDRERMYFLLLIAGAVGLAFSLPKFLKLLWVGLRHLPSDGTVKQIGWALLDALLDAQVVRSPRRCLELRIREIEPGRFSIALAGGTYFESSLFADSLETLLGPIENPRYLLIRKGSAPWHLGRKDFHAVPPALSTKAQVERLHYHWKRRVGPGELIYTRAADGRKALLQARVRAWSNAFAAPAQRRDRWC